jgi:hypothetical protein
MIKHTIFSKFTAMAVLATAACDGLLLVDEEPSSTWEGNAVDCPSEVPLGEPSCDLAEGQLCAYNTPDAFNAGYVEQRLCGCWESSAGERRFHCYEGSSAPYECPAAEPANGQSCVGLFGAECSYPERTSCHCAADTGQWTCTEWEHSVDAPPSSVDPNKPINTLTPSERAEWCDWFASARLGEGFPEDPPPSIDENGYIFNNGCSYGSAFMCAAAVPSIPSATCEANLALSACDAPIAELSDCVTTVYDACWPSPHGCARYLERPGCDGTVVRAYSEGSAGTGGTGGASPGSVQDCSIRVQ